MSSTITGIDRIRVTLNPDGHFTVLVADEANSVEITGLTLYDVYALADQLRYQVDALVK